MPTKGWLTIFMLLIIQTGNAQEQAGAPSSIEERHQQGVDLARNKHYDLGLYLLNQIITYHPNYYPAVRDSVIIYTWKGDCDNALTLYHQTIADLPDLEPYLIAPVAECLAENEKFQESLSLLNKGQARWPDNAELKDKSKSIKLQMQELEQSELEITSGIRKSDDGELEWLFQTRYEQQVYPRTRVFARLFTLQSLDSTSGDLNRIGLGLNYRFNPIWTLRQEFSVEFVHGGDFGSTTGLVFTPNALWNNKLEYTTFSEDIPLRAKGDINPDFTADPNARAKRFRLEANFHTANYQWEWHGSIARSRFSDENVRAEVVTVGGYAFELKENREQRIMIELSGSQNSLGDSVNSQGKSPTYYNPEADLTMLFVYKLDFVLASRFQRHADNIQFRLGTYTQFEEDPKMIGSAEYQQEYEFNDSTSLHWNAGYGFNVYDGNRENTFSLNIGLRKTFK